MIRTDYHNNFTVSYT